MKIDIISLFPKFFNGVFSESILKRAISFDAVEITVYDLREHTTDKHHQADDYLYGGGPGMLLKPMPLFRALDKITAEADTRPVVIFPTPRGKPFQQADADELADQQHLIFICGHYKGIDQRVIDRWVDREYSMGDFVVTGGEVAATAMIDAIVRLLPGVLGDLDSAMSDSFRADRLDCPHYTRPEQCDGLSLPQVLLRGHHRRIKLWRNINSQFLTKKHRPDLIKDSDE